MPGATITVGNVEITAVHDNEYALPLSMVFPGCLLYTSPSPRDRG